MTDTIKIPTHPAVIPDSADTLIYHEEVFSGGRIEPLTEFALNQTTSLLNNSSIPDWYFFILLTVVTGFALINIIYSKYIIEHISSTVNYKLSLKVFNDVSVVRKRVGFALNFIYIISGGLYLFSLSEFFRFSPFQLSGIKLLLFFIIILMFIIILRIVLMGLTSIFFFRKELFSELKWQIFLYNKAIGIFLLPFILLTPYTEDVLQQTSVYVSLTIIGLIYIIRLFRIILFVYNNVVLIFYLFLYLCVLEILPLLIIIRLFTSLVQGS